MTDANGNVAPRRRINFDPTINLGHIATATATLATVVAMWVNLDARVAQQARDLARVETQASKETVRVESVLMDRINTERARLDQTTVRAADDIREIKTIVRDGFHDLDAKLDRKADKPGR